jgi:hypothetical protein
MIFVCFCLDGVFVLFRTLVFGVLRMCKQAYSFSCNGPSIIFIIKFIILCFFFFLGQLYAFKLAIHFPTFSLVLHLHKHWQGHLTLCLRWHVI